MDQQLVDEAITTLATRQGPATAEAVPVYERLAQAMLSRNVSQEKATSHIANVAILRDVLYRLGTLYRSQARSIDERLLQRFDTALMATHYQSLYYAAKSIGLKDMNAKCAITLLKYPTILPQDKALYQAGNAARELGNENLAFMLLNRYCDFI